MRWLRLIVFLVLAGLAGLFGYAYFGDMDAAPQQMRVPVELDLDDTSAAPAPAPAPAAPAAAPATPAPATQGTDDPDAALD